MSGWIKKLTVIFNGSFCKIQEDVPIEKRGKRPMNSKEKELKHLLESRGLRDFVLIGCGVGTAIRLPPKTRYGPTQALHSPPKYLILVDNNLDELVSGLDPKSLQKVGSLTRYILKQITSRVKKEKTNDGQK